MYYCYLSDGTKLSLGSSTSTLTQRYRGSLVYNNGQFESASFGSGRIVGTDNGSEVHYFLTDHLGSTRVVAKVTPTGREDLDRKDYYPFGKEWRQPDMPASDNRYMFSGKERSDICLENDYSSILPIYDFAARNYYPDGVFFLQQDPLMEKYYSIGQYNYCAGNPIKHVDPNGMLIDDYFNHNGQYLGTDNASTDFVQIIGQDDWDANATNGIIDHDTGNNLSTNITEISLSDEAVTNVVAYYNIQLNTSEGNLDVKIKASPIEESPAMQYETEKGFNIGPISVTTRKAVVRINAVDGKIDSKLNTASNITNALVHERDHHTFKGSNYTVPRELHAIDAQRKHSSYDKTTKEFKVGVNNYEKRVKNR